MISFDKFTLSNGLKVVHHYDSNTPLVAINILYNVGSRDENPEMTGLAHLFEHLMFSGSANAPSYDSLLQNAGGENNAFTNNDITNYYITLPSTNFERGLWLESDRMHWLNINRHSLDVQKNVVIEEFKQRYLNQPYGDIWLEFRPITYQKHPYRWATIGKNLDHIKKVELVDIQGFYSKFYNPTNAVMSIAGNVELDECQKLVEKWFSDIPSGIANPNVYVQEDKQTEARYHEIERDVPMEAILIGFPIDKRSDKNFHAMDLFSDIFGHGASSRLFSSLVKEKRIFADVSCFHTDNLDQGLLILFGRILPGTSMEKAEEAIWHQLEIFAKGIREDELEKVKNKKITSLTFSDLDVLNKAMNLASFENMDDASTWNREKLKYMSVSKEDVENFAAQFCTKERSNTLYYRKK